MSDHTDKSKRASRRARKGSELGQGDFRIHIVTHAGILFLPDSNILEWSRATSVENQSRRQILEAVLVDSVIRKRGRWTGSHWELNFTDNHDAFTKAMAEFAFDEGLITGNPILKIGLVEPMVPGVSDPPEHQQPTKSTTYHFVSSVSNDTEAGRSPSPSPQAAEITSAAAAGHDEARALAANVLRSALAELGDANEHLAHIRARLAYVREGAVVQ